MTYVITENCIKCKYTDCVEVCPVDCFHEGPNFLVINPEECIDCSLCEPECPINAILSEDDLKEENKKYLEMNDRLSKKWPLITEAKPAPDDAKEWENNPDKLNLLEDKLRDCRYSQRSEGDNPQILCNVIKRLILLCLLVRFCALQHLFLPHFYPLN